MEECIFCRIVEGKIPCKKLYEESNLVSFLDAFPASLGHCLVIPKKHYSTIIDAPEAELKDLIRVVQKIGSAAMKATKADGFNVVQNNFPAAGQAVHHLHFHIIPRFANDGKKIVISGAKGEDAELKRWEAEIKKHI